MKKAFYTLGILALASFTFASCQKELKPENEQEGKLVTVTFVAETANTKSGVLEEGTTSVSYKWTAEDVSNMKLFTVSGNTLTQVNNPTVSKVSDTKLTITASVAANSTVRAILAKTMDENNNPIVPSIQNPGVDSFDPNADILVSEDEEVKEGMPEEGLIFKRQVTINKMTLHNLGAGEKVSSVKITSDKDLTGDGVSLTLNYNNAIVPESGQFPVYFVAQPNADQNLTVEVVTDQNNYSKTLSAPISFALGSFAKFNVGLQVVAPKFVKVTSSADLTSGNYLIVNEDNGVAFDGSLETLDAVGNAISVTIVDNTIEVNQDTEAAVFEIDFTAGTIMSASGLYIGQTSDANGLSSSASTVYTNTISLEDEEANIVSSGGAYLRYNSASNQLRFRYYKSASYTGQKAIQFYKRVGGAAHFTTWALSSIAVSTPPTKTVYIEGESFNPEGMVVTATYADVSDATNTREEVIANTALTFAPDGALSTTNTTITISYQGKTTTQGITVNPAPTTTLADVLEGGVDEYTVANVTVYAVRGSSIIIGDSSAKMLAYKGSSGLKVGDVRTITGSTVYYSTYTYQFSDPTFSGNGTTEIDHGTVVELDEEASSLTAAFDDPYRHTAVYFHAIGHQEDNRLITTSDGNLLYLSGQYSTTSGKDVEIYGYIYAYSKQYDEFLVCYVSLEEYVNPNAPVITLNKTTITGVAAAGVTNATESGVYTLENATDANLTVTPDGTVVTSASVSNGTLTYTVSANTSGVRNGSVTIAVAGGNTETVTISQNAASGSGPVTLIIDGSQLTSTATTAVSTKTYDGVNVVFSSGAKLQTSSGDNKFTNKAILIGKSGAYIHAAVPGKITKFEIYANKGASTKVSVGVNFSDSEITQYNASASNTYTATLSTEDKVYDCSDKLSANAHYFWYQVTNAYNSQVEFRITYIPE